MILSTWNFEYDLQYMSVSLCKTSNKLIHAFPFQIPFCSFKTVKLNINNDVLFGLSLVWYRCPQFCHMSDMSRWRSGAVVRASDFGPRGPWFEPRPVHISLWP